PADRDRGSCGLILIGCAATVVFRDRSDATRAWQNDRGTAAYGAAVAMLGPGGAAALHHQYDLAPSSLARGTRAIRLAPALERQPVRDHAGEQVSLTLRERQRVRQQPAGRTPAGRVDEVAVVELARREREVLLGVNTDGGECAAWSEHGGSGSCRLGRADRLD